MLTLRRAAALGFWLLLSPAVAFAAGTVCHCFRDREYDPSSPEKSDEYLLATAPNSLLSTASWRVVFRSRAGQLELLGPRFVGALAAGASDAAVARLAAAATLAERLGTPWAELEEVSGRGATLQEMVLAADRPLVVAYRSRDLRRRQGREVRLEQPVGNGQQGPEPDGGRGLEGTAPGSLLIFVSAQAEESSQ